MANKVLASLVTFAYKVWYDFSIEGEENIPPEEGVIIASNHRTYADPVILTMKMKKPVTYMAKEELFRNKLFGAFITALGAFPVKRGAGDMQVIEQCVERLREGKNFVIFPEGTRQKTNKVGRLKTGIAVIAAKSGATVLPKGIIVEGEKLHFRGKVKLRIGKPIPPEDLQVVEGDRHSINAAKAKIYDALKELVEVENE
ncbi:MAG: 1-acyl-sn-glycerol-3-phosphate acyltransferase [Oscillospiraceae bacterium]|nr:1-acyl-sn-glycerol-3-phosphate acyltransferase [Oscillospiraceae bacterium]